jgi:hypothetical protein
MKHKIRCIAGVALLTLSALLLANPPVWAQQRMPDTHLQVTVQQKVKGKISPELHLQELLCFNGKCSLTTITFGSCRSSPVSGNTASPVVLERSSTIEGNLKVTKEGEILVVVETGADVGGNYVTSQRFAYEKPRDGRIIRKLIGYSGGSVKNSIVAQQVITIEYVPLRGSFQEVTLGCPLGLPGVDVSK